MWPMLLNLTRDECRLKLRTLELEAYSNMVNVFRAQGALEDNRKKLLEELRAVLHISHDRHSAEARRVSNDQLLATIAEQLSGPNTGLGWISEGRRRVPLLPRGVPQSAYAEIADKVAEVVAAENREIQKRLEEKLASPKNHEEIPDADSQTAESALSSNETMDEIIYPPIAMEDQTLKLWDTELITRKRKVPEGGAISDDGTTPIKNMRNIPVNTNQKHLNLSQIYSKLSQPASSKPASQSKHSYNQVSKVSSKSQTPRSTQHKPRKTKNTQTPKQPKKSQSKETNVMYQMSPGKQYNSSQQMDYAGPPNTFQASYAQAVLGSKTKSEFDDIKSMSVPSVGEAPPAAAEPSEPTPLPPPPKSVAGKACHLILKNRGEITSEVKPPPGDFKILQKPSEGIKLLPNRQVVVAQNPAQKVVTAPPQKVLSTPGKLVTTKVIGSIPKTRTTNTPVMTEKMIVVSKPPSEGKSLPNSRLVVTSAVSTPMRERTLTSASNVARLTESLTPKGIPATDLKVSAKAVVLNPKSGQKMVVVPAKARTKPGNEGQIPLLHFKGITTGMKLVPVSSQPLPQVAKSSTVTVVSKPATVSSLPTTTKIIGMEPIKTANLADIVPVKGLTPVTTPKITNPILRPSSAKGNVIVVQKGTPIGKALTFAKNGNDMSKIIMGKNVTQLLQASKTEHTDTGKPPGNVIVLELNNEQTGRTTTMSEILDSRGPSTARLSGEKNTTQITAETPVLFDNQLTEETCNTSSLDSTVESIGGIVGMEEAGLSRIEKDDGKSFSKDSEGAKDSSSVTDWEMELDTVSRKDKDDDDKLNSLHLDLGMSSDSDSEYMGTARKPKSKHSTQARQHTATSGESGGIFSGTGMSLATRTLLSQLQDEGSSSNDSSFALKTKAQTKPEPKLDKAESDELTKAKEKLSEKVAEAKSQQRRIDIYSTAITTSDINLDSLYLDESIMAGDDVFAAEENKQARERRDMALHEQLSRLLAEDSTAVSETMPLNK